MNKDFCVVIPIYKESLNNYEIISLKRINNIFKNNDKYFYLPEDLNTKFYDLYTKDFKKIIFNKKYFNSIDSYNILCKLPIFYKPVLDYDYMLLYQLDAYIFDEKEIYGFIEAKFDYIGAPWLNLRWLNNSQKIVSKIPYLSSFVIKVGNGGLSLRKIETFYKFSNRFSFFAKIITLQEDIYWSNFASRLIINFNLPQVKEALEFSFDDEPEECFLQNQNKLPFGCHSWDKNYNKFWYRYIDVKK